MRTTQLAIPALLISRTSPIWAFSIHNIPHIGSNIFASSFLSGVPRTTTFSNIETEDALSKRGLTLAGGNGGIAGGTIIPWV